MLKKKLLKYNYPQIVFARQIFKYLNSSGKHLKTIIDCPCGNGETSFNISKLTDAQVIAADISSESISCCKKNFSATNLNYEVSTIESVLNFHKEFDAFCIINSLFLLENYDAILKMLSENVNENKAQVIIIIPNTAGKNFKWFQSQNTNENKLVIKENEIETFFSKHHFKVQLIKPICFAHHYSRKDVKLFSVFWSIYLNLINNIQTALKIGKANYFLIALSSQNS
jgi:2-polyprenyl-3-methyl-5-hydroxy-6-metoxy-1,4-benzoquinol methylase